jgi:hypothetical protein
MSFFHPVPLSADFAPTGGSVRLENGVHGVSIAEFGIKRQRDGTGQDGTGGRTAAAPSIF